MATVTLADVIDVTVFKDLPAVNSPEKTAFWESGVVTTSPLFGELADAAGKVSEMPFWNDIDADDDVNLSSDDPTEEATPSKVTQGEQIARKHMVNKGWDFASLATDLAMGGDAIQHVRNRTDAYFARQAQKRLIKSALGVMADNIANDSGDMVHAIAAEATGSQSASTLFSRGAFIEASYTMGDMVDGIVAMAVHSQVAKQMADQGDVEDVRDANGVLVERSYMGRRLIIDDNMPVIAGSTSGFKYVSVLFGTGAFGYGEGNAPRAVSIDTNERAGNGAGTEELWVRKKYLLHPLGFATGTAPAKDSYSLTELAAAASWNRVVDRKNVPLAFLVTN